MLSLYWCIDISFWLCLLIVTTCWYSFIGFWPRYFCCLSATASSLHLPQQLLMLCIRSHLPSTQHLLMLSASAFACGSRSWCYPHLLLPAMTAAAFDAICISYAVFRQWASSLPSITHPPSLQFDCHQRPWMCISFEALVLSGPSALTIELSHLLPFCTSDCNHHDSTEHISFELWLCVAHQPSPSSSAVNLLPFTFTSPIP